MSDSSYSSTAPKPLQAGHAPRGLLKENRIGVSAGAAAPDQHPAGRRPRLCGTGWMEADPAAAQLAATDPGGRRLGGDLASGPVGRWGQREGDDQVGAAVVLCSALRVPRSAFNAST